MHLIKRIVFLFCLMGLPLAALAAQPAGEHVVDPHAAAAAHEAHHGLPPAAVPIARIGFFTITNSMVVTWIVAALLILISQLATRNIQLVPSGLQNFWEYIVESLYEFLEGLLGHDLIKKSFWFFATIFIFILFTNWFGLFPGVGTIGWKYADGTFEPWLRGGNADLNMTAAMALIFFFLWLVWSIQMNGVTGFLGHIFGSQGGGGAGFMKFFLMGIFFFVGLIEVISILFRPVSLSFRLYGNIFAGENILEKMMVLVPWLGWLLPVPFYFLEMLVGLVQALVFTLLTAVFTALMIPHHEEHAEAHH